MAPRQGDILHLAQPKMYILVLSRAFFNASGLVAVCPVVASAAPDALHIPVSTDRFNGIALLEQLRTLDLQARWYSQAGRIDLTQIQDISDAVQNIFDYFPSSDG